MDRAKNQQILNFIQQNKLAVISTSSPKGKPSQSALIAYVSDDNFCLYFQTSFSSRKVTNLVNNPNCSFVIGLNFEDKATLQYEGTAKALTKTRDINDFKNLFLAKNSPTTSEFLDRPDATFYKVLPSWLRFSDYRSSTHATISELNEF